MPALRPSPEGDVVDNRQALKAGTAYGLFCCFRGWVREALRSLWGHSSQVKDTGPSLLTSIIRHVHRVLADLGSEQANDVWDLAVFGHPGGLSLTGITQDWLRDATKR